MPEDDAWDWPLLLYSATVILKRHEREFWRMTPRKLKALVDVHVELHGDSSDKPSKQKVGYIDQVF